MSKTVLKEFTLLGVTLATPVPADAAAWDEIAGTPGDCVATAIENHGYRGFASPARTAMLKALKEQKGVSAGEKESDNTFIKRILEEGVISKAEWQELGANAVTAAGVTFEKTLAESGTSRSKVGEKYVESAKELVKAFEEGRGNPENTIAKIRADVPNAQIPADPTDPLGWAYLLRARAKAIENRDLL